MNTPEPTGPRKITAEDPPQWAEDAAFEWLMIAHQSNTVALANKAGLASIIAKHAPPTAPEAIPTDSTGTGLPKSCLNEGTTAAHATPPPAGTETAATFGPIIVECVPTQIGRCFRIGTAEMFAQEKRGYRRLPSYACIYDDHTYDRGQQDTITKQFAYFIMQACNNLAALRHELAAVTALLEKRTVALRRCQKVVQWCKESGVENAQITAAFNAAHRALAATPESALKEKEGAS